jgi:hypothetical protein
MTLSCTATVDTVTKTVSVLVAGGTPPYALQATPVGGAAYTVKGAWTGAGATLTKIDGEVRLNLGTQYSATDAASGAASSATVTVTATEDVLSNAQDATQVVPVLVVSQTEQEWEARTVTWDVLDREDPFISTGPMRLRSGPLVLRVSQDERADLDALLQTGAPLLLRSVTPTAVDDMTFVVQRRSTRLVLDDLPSGDRLYTLDYQAVSRDLGVISAATRTWNDVLAEASTWTDLQVKFATWDDVRTGRQR